MKLEKNEALRQLSEHGSPFIELFRHGTLDVEIYSPQRIDRQLPHARDEVYVIISGTGDFLLNKERTEFAPGDLLFVPAGAIHRFENFSEDFATWVIFYGPEGGEKS